MELKKLKALVKYCRSVGISHYECSEVKFDLLPYSPKEENKVAKKIELAEKSAMERIASLSEEDLLLYSSTGYVDPETKEI